MTVVNVIEDYDRFFKLFYVEFLEFICRIAFITEVPETDI